MTAPVIPGSSGGLAEALNILLDKGLVIDAMVKVTVIGIEVLTIEIKVVIASVDTYIRYLEAMQRLDAAKAAGNGHGPTPTPPTTPTAPLTHPQGLAGTYGLLPTPAPVPVHVPAAPVLPPAPAPAPAAPQPPAGEQ